MQVALNTSPDATEEQIGVSCTSSNLSYYESVWAVAKRTRGIWRLAAHELPEIVAEQGLLWIKLCSINERRLIMQLAKDGWRHPDDSSDEEEDDDHVSIPDDRSSTSEDDDALPILKAAQKVVKAASENPIDYKHPRVQMIFTKIDEGRIPQVDALLNDIRSLGVEVLCKSSIDNALRLEDALAVMLEPQPLNLSDTLNIDCTILLALVSDISHGSVDEQPWFNTAIRRQIEGEAKEPLLPEKIYPLLSGRALICTQEAVVRMQDIVDLIGTDAEKKRTRILLGLEAHAGSSPNELLDAMQDLSAYKVPRQWRLPIKAVQAEYDGRLPPVAVRIAQDRESRKQPTGRTARKKREAWTSERPLLSPLNQSVFFHGWAQGLTTITSNRSVAKQIEARVYEYRSSEEERGPSVWISSVTRSLLAKEKDRNVE